MAYATPLDVLERIDPDLLAHVAIPAPHRVDAVLMAAAIRNELGGYSAQEEAIAALAMTRMNRALEDSAGFIDFYLRKRHSLPLVSVPPLLIELNVRLMYFKLLRIPSEAQRNDFNDCVKQLQAEADGKGSMGIEAATPVGGGSVVVIGGDIAADLAGY